MLRERLGNTVLREILRNTVLRERLWDYGAEGEIGEHCAVSQIEGTMC